MPGQRAKGEGLQQEESAKHEARAKHEAQRGPWMCLAPIDGPHSSRAATQEAAGRAPRARAHGGGVGSDGSLAASHTRLDLDTGSTVRPL